MHRISDHLLRRTDSTRMSKQEEVLYYEYHIDKIENGVTLKNGSHTDGRYKTTYYKTVDDAKYAIIHEIEQTIQEKRPTAG